MQAWAASRLAISGTGVPVSLRAEALSAAVRSSPKTCSSSAAALLFFRFLPTLSASPCSAACWRNGCIESILQLHMSGARLANAKLGQGE